MSKPAQKPTTEKCFTIVVDGKKYGPFLDRHRAKVLRLEHLHGIEIDTIWLSTGWVDFSPPPPPRSKKDRSLPLLEGTGFVPVSRGW